MRMWMVDPTKMCRKHLLGEHVELHMLIGSLTKNRSVSGFLSGGLIEPSAIWSRHEALVNEMTRRGMKHKSPLPHIEISLDYLKYRVNISDNEKELNRRCAVCKF